MEKVHFSGTVQTKDYEDIVQVVTYWVGDPSVKLRNANEEIVYQDKLTHIYINNPLIRGATVDKFVIEGEREGDLETVRRFLTALAQACKDRQLELEITYWAIDADGNDIGDEYEL